MLCVTHRRLLATGSSHAAIESAQALIQRVLPSHAGRFVCELLTRTSDSDTFSYARAPRNRIALRGTNALSLAVAFNQYLRHEAKVSFDWLATGPLNSDFALPVPATSVAGTSQARERFFLNYCTYGYTFPWWDWSQWERFLDWMALNGINRPLLQAGQESVWLNVWQSFGMSEQQVRSYFSGPAHLPWHRMANLDRWGGPLPLSYIDGQRELQQKILARARELGMQPILAAFAGHVPTELKKLRPDARITRITPGWGGMAPEYATSFLDPLDPLFLEIQKRFLIEQTRIYGTDHRYAADPFNELEPPSWEPAYLAQVSKAIFDGMAAVDARALWYQMAWTYRDERWLQNERLPAMLQAVPRGKLILLDYACEEDELYRKTQSFYGHPFIWNYLGNYGGNTHLLAPLEQTRDKIAVALRVTGCQGVGSTLEGLNVNPIIYELVLEQPWHAGGTLDLAAWVTNYAVRRGGQSDTAVIDAWHRLAVNVFGKSGERRNGCIFQVYPSWKGIDLWTRPEVTYEPRELTAAVERMFEAKASVQVSDPYRFDIVNLTREVLGNKARDLYLQMRQAYEAADVAQYRKVSTTFVLLAADLDLMLGTRHEFLLGPWIAQARCWGRTPDEADGYERNARQILTTWHSAGGELCDYANRQWHGLVRTYYLPRWQKFIEIALGSLEMAVPLDSETYAAWERDFATGWVQRKDETLALLPAGDALATARRMFLKYSEGSSVK